MNSLRQWIVIGVLSFPLFCLAQQPMNPAHDTSAFQLGTYQWKNRLLFVFAPSARSPAYETQMQLLDTAGEGSFEDRDLLLIQVLEEGNSTAGDRALSPAEAEQLRTRFDVNPDQFVVILVGKDGTEKRRSVAPLKAEVFFEQIDAMPMRQREMRGRGDG